MSVRESEQRRGSGSISGPDRSRCGNFRSVQGTTTDGSCDCAPLHQAEIQIPDRNGISRIAHENVLGDRHPTTARCLSTWRDHQGQ